MKLTEILKRNRELGSSLTGDKYKIALVSNITISQLKEILEFSLRAEGIKAEVAVGDYDAIVQDSGRFSGSDAVLFFWELGNLVDGLHCRAPLLAKEELCALAERVEGEIDLVLRSLQHTPLVLINRFSSALFDTDPLRDGPLKQLCKRLNGALESKVGSNQIVVDIDAILAKVGLGAAVDFRQFQSSKALYSIDFFKAYAEAVKRAFLAAAGRSKKVLVLDCDNTLWAGILGEDGETGIQMGEATPKGTVFREVQTILRCFRKDGVLLAICSKNNAADVDKVMASHPDMVLREEDLAAKKINWQDKATNLRELATELNLGLDSFVFVDDSSFELGLIQKELPEVECVQVPQNLSEYPAMMSGLKLVFFGLSRTSEDDRKTEMYRQEQRRKDQAIRFDSIEEYLASLDLRLKILWGRDIPVSRAAQLTQKTNQFNLTTRRYTEAEIQRMLFDPDYTLAVFSVADRYGDYGVTGLTIIRSDGGAPSSALIDSYLMSCRVIGRNVEYAFFDEIVQSLRHRDITKLRAEYLATPKNSQVARFYDDLGFEQISVVENRREYLISLSDYEPREIRYIAINSGGS